MDKEKAKSAIDQIDSRIATINQNVAALKQDRQRHKSELTGIKNRKKTRLKNLQEDINKSRLPLQKKQKRATKEREANSFDRQIESKDRQIDRIDNQLADKGKEIADLKKVKQDVKIAMKNKNV